MAALGCASGWKFSADKEEILNACKTREYPSGNNALTTEVLQCVFDSEPLSCEPAHGGDEREMFWYEHIVTPVLKTLQFTLRNNTSIAFPGSD
ncbi:MAG: hypothetical protein LBP34_04765 [Flavobacteriaceae bacterium]|nr:hypothetical protein [Flavobacteriaceae bacterium]